MKKNILLISLLITISSTANEYKVFVSPNQTDFKIVKGYTDEISYSNWTTENESCHFDLLESEIYFGKSGIQNEICNQNQSRIKTVTRVYSDGSEQILSETKENRSDTITKSTNSITGTHIEPTCKDAKLFDNTLEDGSYTVNYKGTNSIVYCNMTIDGGGWTLVDEVIQPTLSVLPSIKTLDDKNVPYNDVYFESTDTHVSFQAPINDNDLDYDGFQESITRIKENGSWKTYTSMNYKIITEGRYCYYVDGDTSYRCAVDLVLNDVSNVEGLSDVETITQTSHTDNMSKYNFKFYVR